MERHYVNGLPHGTVRYWDRDGHLESEMTYENGERHGLYSVWRSDGTLLCNIEYVHGLVEDIVKANGEEQRAATTTKKKEDVAKFLVGPDGACLKKEVYLLKVSREGDDIHIQAQLYGGTLATLARCTETEKDSVYKTLCDKLNDGA